MAEQALLKAVTAARYTQTRLLLQMGADVNGQDSAGQTPLMRALALPDAKVRTSFLRLLLRSGALVSTADRKRSNALMVACDASPDDEDVILLLQHQDVDLDINARNSAGQTALWTAVNRGKVEVVRRLLGELSRQDLLSEVPDVQGLTPAMRAAMLGHHDCLRAMVAQLASAAAANPSSQISVVTVNQINSILKRLPVLVWPRKVPPCVLAAAAAAAASAAARRPKTSPLATTTTPSIRVISTDGRPTLTHAGSSSLLSSSSLSLSLSSSSRIRPVTCLTSQKKKKINAAGVPGLDLSGGPVMCSTTLSTPTKRVRDKSAKRRGRSVGVSQFSSDPQEFDYDPITDSFLNTVICQSPKESLKEPTKAPSTLLSGRKNKEPSSDTQPQQSASFSPEQEYDPPPLNTERQYPEVFSKVSPHEESSRESMKVSPDTRRRKEGLVTKRAVSLQGTPSSGAARRGEEQPLAQLASQGRSQSLRNVQQEEDPSSSPSRQVTNKPLPVLPGFQKLSARRQVRPGVAKPLPLHGEKRKTVFFQTASSRHGGGGGIVVHRSKSAPMQFKGSVSTPNLSVPLPRSRHLSRTSVWMSTRSSRGGLTVVERPKSVREVLPRLLNVFAEQTYGSFRRAASPPPPPPPPPPPAPLPARKAMRGPKWSKLRGITLLTAGMSKAAAAGRSGGGGGGGSGGGGGGLGGDVTGGKKGSSRSPSTSRSPSSVGVAPDSGAKVAAVASLFTGAKRRKSLK